MNSGQAHLKHASRRPWSPSEHDISPAWAHLISATTKPSLQLLNGGIEPMWIHEGTVSFPQKTQITDQDHFIIQLGRYADVWDELCCYELTSSIYSDRNTPDFFKYMGKPQLSKSSWKFWWQKNINRNESSAAEEPSRQSKPMQPRPATFQIQI